MDEKHDSGRRERLPDRFGKGGAALYTFVTCLLALAVSGLAAYLTKQPLLFPSLGPTAFMFFETPLAESASPRNAMIGHAVAISAGVFSLAAFRLLHAPNVLQAGVSPARIGAAALSVALTGAVLLVLRSGHPPAGATTLIVSLGLFERLNDLIALALGVVLLTIVGWLMNRALGVPVPPWGPQRAEDAPGGDGAGPQERL
jgi:CBS domain-containing membrane protein